MQSLIVFYDSVPHQQEEVAVNGDTPPATAPAESSAPDGRTCAGLDNAKFMGRDDMNDKIDKFCADAATQKVQDQGSGSTVRKYNEGTRYEVSLSMDWPSGTDITKDMEANCKSAMTSIMNGKILCIPQPRPNIIPLTLTLPDCDGGDPKNPLNWKHGGSNSVNPVTYHIDPTQDQGYTPGTCSFHLQEDESWTGIDGPGTERIFTYHIEQALMKDGAGKEIGRLGFKKDSGDGDPQEEGDGNPLEWETKLSNKLQITSEAQGDPKDYIQFTIESQSWKTSDANAGNPRCEVGGWSGDFTPIVSLPFPLLLPSLKLPPQLL